MPSSMPSSNLSSSPIGVFDSGIGGLSVLRALRAELPQEKFVYLADVGFAPYGERGDAFVRARTEAIAPREIGCRYATIASVSRVRLWI